MKNWESLFMILRNLLNSHLIIKLLIIAIVMDCFFGIIRAGKYKKSNSSIGIDGVIRKASMLAGMAFFILIDYMLNINLIDVLIKVIPEKFFDYLPMNNMGLTEFFGLLFLAYESMSVLKNMVLCNLPVKKVWIFVNNVLLKYTDELPSTDLTQEEAIKQMAGDIQTISRSLTMKEKEGNEYAEK